MKSITGAARSIPRPRPVGRPRRDAAGQATGAQLIANTPAGQYIKPLGGAWTKK